MDGALIFQKVVKLATEDFRAKVSRIMSLLSHST